MRRITLAVLLAALALPASAAAKNPWLKSTPLNIAHQGGEDEFPSNTMYAFRRALAVGADMLELDVGVTKDGQVVVMHDTTVDRTTNGHGTIASHTLAQIRRLDGAYWFSGGAHAYDHGRARSAYRLRGVATGKRRPPAGFKRSDFRVPTLREVLRAFPHTPINVEIKGRTKKEELSEYLTNADALARTLKGVTRKDLIVVSFKQEAVDRFHQLRPNISVAPGIGGSADYLLGGKSPGRAWSRSSCRSPSCSTARCSTSPPPTASRRPTATASPGRCGSATATPTRRRRGASSSPGRPTA